MDTFRGDVNRITHTNATSTDIDASDVVVKVDMVGVAVEDIPAGEDGALEIWGRHELPATAGMSWSQGDTLYWNETTLALTTTASAWVKAGKAAKDKASADTTAEVLLNFGS